jgi:hypothetical protein
MKPNRLYIISTFLIISLLTNIFLLISNNQKVRRITNLCEKITQLDLEKAFVIEELEDCKSLFTFNFVQVRTVFCNNDIKVGEYFDPKIYLTSFNVNFDSDSDIEEDYIVFGGKIDSQWNYSGDGDTVFVEGGVGRLSIKGMERGKDTIHCLYHHFNNGRLHKFVFRIPYSVY